MVELTALSAVLGALLCSVGAMLCAGGGIGGGAWFIGVFMLLFELSAHAAIPLSKVCIFGVASGSLLFLARRRHPSADRPLIDYRMAALFEPMTLFGSLIGVLLNVVFPAYLIAVFLVLLLGTSAALTLRKGAKLFRKESAERRAASLEHVELIENDSASSLDGEDTFDQENDFSAINEDSRPVNNEKESVPWLIVSSLGVVWSVVMMLTVLRGGGASESVVGVECGSFIYWLLLALSLIILLVYAGLVGLYLAREDIRRQRNGWTPLPSDVALSLRTTLALPALCTLAGVAAGFLGIGGGMVKV